MSDPDGEEMAERSYDAPFIFGLHDPGGERLMLSARRPGWVVVNEYIGHDPDDMTSADYSALSDQGVAVLCRLNNGREPEGTIPHSSLYEQFARRVANFVAGSRGCNKWIIGNEMNYAVERPGILIDWSRHGSIVGDTPEESDPFRHGIGVRFNFLPDHSTEIRTTRAAIVEPGEVITPDVYSECFKLCRDAVRKLPDGEKEQLIVGAVAPWNTQTIYGSNANGDWVRYFADILETLGPDDCDGFALHTYTHGCDPALITSDELLGPPFQTHHLQFRAYRDFLDAVPTDMRHLPAYITESDQSEPWDEFRSGWIRAAYAEIDEWNRRPDIQRIRALALYRWSRIDRWHIDGKQSVIDDFAEALTQDYRWHWETEHKTEAPATATAGARRAGRRAAERIPEYSVQWIDSEFPAHLTAGKVVTARILVKNTGSMPWKPSDEHLLQIGYRYLRNRRELHLGDEKQIRTDITTLVEPEGSTSLSVRVALPDEPGNYTLEIDIFSGLRGWFREEGSQPLTRWLTVEPPKRSSDDGQGVSLPVPLFTDVSGRLPRSGFPYARRELDQIEFLVLSHTAANPSVRLSHIARTHIRYGYPGIVYDFVVDSSGQVFKVSDLHDVAQPQERWSERGVNICLVGDFSDRPPPIHQLDATSRLCAWLAQNLGVSADSVVGLGEVTGGTSPGETFYRGVTWKAILAAQIRLHLAALTGHGDTGRVQELSTVLAENAAEREATAERIHRLEGERSELTRLNQQLQQELLALERRMRETATETIGGVSVHNCVDSLPRDESRYRTRRAQDVRYVVIHHSAMDVGASLEEIAFAHRQEWPGILFDYYIDRSGEIFQTQPLEEVVDSDEEYISSATHIGFAGTFDDDVPTSEQLGAGGKLIAWLSETFPLLGSDSVKGLSEFVESNSPGTMWQSGRRWKAMLIAAVSRHRGAVAPSEAEEQLRKRMQELEDELASKRRQNQELIEVRHLLEGENRRLQQQMSERQESSRSYMVPKPATQTIVDDLPAHPTLRYERRDLGQITHLAVHHTATPPSMGPRKIAELHVASDPTRGKEAWPGIGYHYYIHADGTIDQTNPLETASYHVYRHNDSSVGIVFAGSFMNGRIPSSAQLRSGAHLVAWLMQELNITLARVWGHREFPDNTTVCPGSEWIGGNRWRDLLFERIEQILAGVGVKSIRHYMLFWQRAYPGPLAHDHFLNATEYMVRFRPTVGFSVQDARTAEYVTIVGGEAGITQAEERSLRQSGCRVERIAGRNDDETRRMLNEMAESGQRFRKYDVDF